MKTIHLTPSPINRDAFAPYGNIIASQDDIELSAVSVIKDNANTAVKVIRANQYNSGVWHTPFCALDANKNFVVLDRHPNTNDESTINIKFAKFKNTEIFVKI